MENLTSFHWECDQGLPFCDIGFRFGIGVIDIHRYPAAIPITCPDHHFFSKHVVNLDFRYIVFALIFNDQFPLKGIGINLNQVVRC